MLEQFFDNNFKGFRDEIRSELNGRIFTSIQDKRQEVAEDFFTEAKGKLVKTKETMDPKSEEDRRVATADFAMKQDVFSEEDNRKKSSSTKKLSMPDEHQHRILKDTIRNPLKGKFLGGPSSEEAEEILRKKFGYNDAQIQKLREDVFSEENLNELNKDTLGRYIKNAAVDVSNNSWDSAWFRSKKRDKAADILNNKSLQRQKGISTATDKLVKGDYTKNKRKKVNEDTAEYLLTLVYPDGERQNDFCVMGANETDVNERLSRIFGEGKGYKFENIRKNEG